MTTTPFWLSAEQCIKDEKALDILLGEVDDNAVVLVKASCLKNLLYELTDFRDVSQSENESLNEDLDY